MSLTGGLIPLGSSTASKLRSNSLSDEFDNDFDSSNFDNDFDEILSTPIKGQSSNKTNISSVEKKSSSRNNKSNTFVSSNSDFLLSSSDSFSSPVKKPSQEKKSNPNAKTSSYKSEDESYSGAFSLSDSADIHFPSSTPDKGLKKSLAAGPSPVTKASTSKGNDSEFDLEDSILGTLTGETRSRRPSRILSEAVKTSVISTESDSTYNFGRHNTFEDDKTTLEKNRPATSSSGGVLNMDALSGMLGRKTNVPAFQSPSNIVANMNTPVTNDYVKPFGSPRSDVSKSLPNLNFLSSSQVKQYPSDDETYTLNVQKTASNSNSRMATAVNSPKNEANGIAEANFGSTTPKNSIQPTTSTMITPTLDPPKKDSTDDSNLGFIPSFLDPDRKSRSRRGGLLSRSLGSSAEKNSMEDLDRALGLSSNNFGSNNTYSQKSDHSENRNINSRLLTTPSESPQTNESRNENDSQKDSGPQLSSGIAAVPSKPWNQQSSSQFTDISRPTDSFVKQSSSSSIFGFNSEPSVSAVNESQLKSDQNWSRPPNIPQYQSSTTSPRANRVQAPPTSPSNERLVFQSSQMTTPVIVESASDTKLKSSFHLPTIIPSTSPSNASTSPAYGRTIHSPKAQAKSETISTSISDRAPPPPLPLPDSPVAVRDLMQQLNDMKLEKLNMERKHEAEIEYMKQRLLLYQQSISNSQLSDQKSADKKYETDNRRLQFELDEMRKERDDLKSRVVYLEKENNIQRDDAIFRENKHRDEIDYTIAKHEAEIKNLKRHWEEETRQLEIRHSASLETLKTIHKDELQAFKERYRDKSTLEELLSQLSTTAGSIKFIEEQLVAKHHGVEAVKQGQIEARERLVKELEDQARNRIESAEVEGFKVKGLLLHLEHMAGGLQQQLVEDKLRLRQENERCVALQKSLEQERQLHHERCTEELAVIKSKLRDAEIEQQKLSNAILKHQEKVASDEQRLAADRKELKQLASEQAHLAASTTKQLKEDEDRLNQLRQDIAKEIKELESKRLLIRNEMEQAEAAKQQVLQLKHQVEIDKQQHEYQVAKFKSSSLQYEQTIKQVQQQAGLLDQRERVLQQGMEDMREAANRLGLKQRELTQLQDLLQHQQSKQLQKEEELSQSQLARYTSERQYLSKIASSSPPPNDKSPTNENRDGIQQRLLHGFNTQSPHDAKNGMLITSTPTYDRYETPLATATVADDYSINEDWADDFKRKLSSSKGAKILALANLASSTSDHSYLDIQQAKKTLQQAKSQLHYPSLSASAFGLKSSIQSTDSHIRRESDFLVSLRQSKQYYI